MMLPINTTLKRWADSLIVDFPFDDIPILSNEENWKDWGNFLIQRTSFANNQAPGTSPFNDRFAWAMAVYKQMANN
jgi:hypothetical protein